MNIAILSLFGCASSDAILTLVLLILCVKMQQPICRDVSKWKTGSWVTFRE